MVSTWIRYIFQKRGVTHSHDPMPLPETDEEKVSKDPGCSGLGSQQRPRKDARSLVVVRLHLDEGPGSWQRAVGYLHFCLYITFINAVIKNLPWSSLTEQVILTHSLKVKPILVRNACEQYYVAACSFVYKSGTEGWVPVVRWHSSFSLWSNAVS